MGDPDFPQWFAERIGECVTRLHLGLVERGEPLSPEVEAAGESEAQQFLESLRVPDCPTRCAHLYPRLWAAQTFIDRAVVRPALRIWNDLNREEVLQVLLLTTWLNRGKPKWEQARYQGPKWSR